MQTLTDDVKAKRTSVFGVEPDAHWKRVCLLELLDGSASLFNEVNYHRRQYFFDNDDPSLTQVKRAITKNDYRLQYKHRLGSATAQQMMRKNDEAWKSFFEQRKQYRDSDNEQVTDKPSIPGYWKHDDGKRYLHTCIRNDQYTVEWGERSRLEIPVGSELKEKYGLGGNERLRLPIKGDPKWDGEQCRLELVYDRTTDSFTAHRTFNVCYDTLDTPSLVTDSSDEGDVAAVDAGANNLVAVTTTTGHQRVYHGRPLFHCFRALTESIAELQSQLDDDEYSSKRIQRVYDVRREQRDHAQDALIRDLVEWLVDLGVTDVYVGDLRDVLETHWSAEVNEKTHNFWAHGRFCRRLAEVGAEYGVEVHGDSEAWTSTTCPECGDDDATERNKDMFLCRACGFEGHADLVGSENFLTSVVGEADGKEQGVGPMARPVVREQNSSRSGHRSVPRLQWDDHDWEPIAGEPAGRSTNEDSTNRSTRKGNLASESETVRLIHRGIPRL